MKLSIYFLIISNIYCEFVLSGKICANGNMDRIHLKEVYRDPENAPSGMRQCIRYKQTWKGLNVLGHGSTKSKSGKVASAKIARCISDELSVKTPNLSYKKALKIATNHIKLHLNESFKASQMQKKTDCLAVFVDPNDKKPKLVYLLDLKVITRATKKSFTQHFKIDANSGEKLQYYFTDSYMEVQCNEKSHFKLYNRNRDKSIKVNCMQCHKNCTDDSCPDCGFCQLDNGFISVHNSKGSSGPSTDTCDNVAQHKQHFDAYFYMTEYVNMMNNEFNFNLTGKFMKKTFCKTLKAFVKADKTMFDDKSKTKECCEFFFEAENDNFFDFISSTSVGHEMGHAVISATSELTRTCQTGAIHESFADLSATILKAYFNDWNHDWKLGTELVKNNIPIRHMDNPPLDNFSIDCTQNYMDMECAKQDTFKPGNYLDIHHTSGVYNKAIYNLVTSSNRWDVQSVYKVFLRATEIHWGEEDTFNEAFCGLEEALKDLYGDNHIRLLDFRKAFAKVGVFCKIPLINYGCPLPNLNSTFCKSRKVTYECTSTVECFRKHGSGTCCTIDCGATKCFNVEKKAGVCPYVTVSKAPFCSIGQDIACTMDSHCQGKQKCCLDMFRRFKCSEDGAPAAGPIIRWGCPIPNLDADICRNKKPAFECNNTVDCFDKNGESLCCGGDCGSRVCYVEEHQNPGRCPFEPLGVAGCGNRRPLITCGVDRECGKRQKCCFDGCTGTRCVDPKGPDRIKFGCPYPPSSDPDCTLPKPNNQCLLDRDCPKGSTCCQHACGFTHCIEVEHSPGKCPKVAAASEICKPASLKCGIDADCPKPAKCCATQCDGSKCVAPCADTTTWRGSVKSEHAECKDCSCQKLNSVGVLMARACLDNVNDILAGCCKSCKPYAAFAEFDFPEFP